MPLNIEPPIEKEFVLERSDKELGNTGEPTTILVRQAREGENIRRMELWARFERRMNMATDDISIAQEVSPAIVRRKEVFLTLKGCSITMEGKPLFKFPLKESEFNSAWDKLPSVIADEIHEKVLEVNIDWAASGEAV